MNKDVMWLIFVFILVGIVFNLQRKNVWIFGPPSPAELPPAATTPPPPPEQGKPTTTPQGQDKPKSAGPKIRISAANAYVSSPANEYIVLENIDYENKAMAAISNFLLKNRDKLTAAIGKDENGNAVELGYGERAILVTGENPLGRNFKINKCSGYFNQRAAFSPPIYTACPALSNMALPSNLNNTCINYIESLPACIMPTINADTGINNDCDQFVQAHASYAGCVADYKNDKDFDKGEWRIYLSKNTELWDNRHDLIQLFDPAGKLITELSY